MASLTPSPTATATVTPTAPATATRGPLVPVLLDRYVTSGYASEYEFLTYRPRQFVAGYTYNDPTWGPETYSSVGAYAGWDVFETASEGIARTFDTTEWYTLTLKRPGRVAIVWRSSPPLPTWLSSWTDGGSVAIPGTRYPVFTKEFPAGPVVLGGVNSPGSNAVRDGYLVLLAEAGGVPSVAPVPLAQSGPLVPNETCPAWVHAQHTTVRDGRPYATWHRQIDPVYYCYHRHEHGSDPRGFGDGTHTPAYHLAASQHPHGEPEPQFKSAFWEYNGWHWYLTIHFGTSDAQRGACNRYHETSIAVARPGGPVQAELTWMADFGATVRNTSSPEAPLDLSGLGCPDQALIEQQTYANKLVPVGALDDPSLVLYYPWRSSIAGNILGVLAHFLMNTPDAMAICSDMKCSQNIVTGNSGTLRFVQPQAGFGIDASKAAATGVFYTDSYGLRVLPAGAPGAVRQYIAPGLNALHPYVGDNGGMVTGPGYDDLFTNRYKATFESQQGNSQQLERQVQGVN